MQVLHVSATAIGSSYKHHVDSSLNSFRLLTEVSPALPFCNRSLRSAATSRSKMELIESQFVGVIKKKKIIIFAAGRFVAAE